MPEEEPRLIEDQQRGPAIKARLDAIKTPRQAYAYQERVRETIARACMSFWPSTRLGRSESNLWTT